MTDKLREQVSALVDNELDAGQTDLLLRRIGADPDLRGTVERYVLMGETIRDALAPARMGEFADQVGSPVFFKHPLSGRLARALDSPGVCRWLLKTGPHPFRYAHPLGSRPAALAR